MSQVTRFSYQQLQYCPQRNVPSISKQKHFNSTVSKYDPRTKRTTRIINCVPYDQLIAKDRSRCCFPEPPIPFPPITTQTIFIRLRTYGITPVPFYIRLTGTGYFIYGYDGVPHLFSASTPTLFQFNPVYDLATDQAVTISIHTSDITYLDVSGNNAYVVETVVISGAPTLQTFICRSSPSLGNFEVVNNPNLRYLDLYNSAVQNVTYFDYCRNITYIDIRNNNIMQEIAENMAERLVSNATRNGTLKISNQFSVVLDINTTPFNTLRNTLGWTIT